MLILSRKKDECIVINDNIKVYIVDVKSDVVKIGIEAPKDIKVFREEVWKSIYEENIQAVVDEKKGIVPSLSNIEQALSSNSNPKKD